MWTAVLGISAAAGGTFRRVSRPRRPRTGDYVSHHPNGKSPGTSVYPDDA